MCNTNPRSQAAGFALTEALVASLLLAIATIGAGSAMVASLAGQRSALLRTQAADLAANLAEALRSAPDAASQEAEIRSWRSAVTRELPQAEPGALRRPSSQPDLPGSPATGFIISLQWRDGHVAAPAQLTLPLSLVALAGGS